MSTGAAARPDGLPPSARSSPSCLPSGTPARSRPRHRQKKSSSTGKAKALSDVAIHVDVADMQIAEDTQLIFGHMLVQWLRQFRHET